MKNLYGEEHDPKNSIEKEWIGMPEYRNVVQDDAFVTAIFKFRNQEDYDFFMDVVKTQLYEGECVFYGMQRKSRKTAWYPLNEKPSKHRYV